MSKKLPVVWDAEPHTIAKIEILKGYLQAWLRILGKTRNKQTILYVDGFAGPGRYRNHEEGSPLAALRVAQQAIHELGAQFIAQSFHGAFIESERARFEVLTETLLPFEKHSGLGITKMCCEFVSGIERLKKELPGPFQGDGPLFIFADPFGGTGIPFITFADCMRGDTAELLINLDSDGIGRIFFAESNNNRDDQLTEIFGSECWREALTATDLKRLSVQILDLYKKRLRTLPSVKFIWSFAMRGRHDAINYHLVFATKHPLGMEKMKEAMRAIDKTGSYSFSDAHVEQHVLFRDDDEQTYAAKMFQEFCGRTVTMDDVHVYALNETPFISAKTMLAILERKEHLQVETQGTEPRRAGSFPEHKIRTLRFGRFGTKTIQDNFSF